jgi:6-phosphogluconolactonase
VITARRIFGSRDELADTLARDVAAALAAVMARKGHAVLAVSGGTTPALFFSCLSQAKIDWSNVTVTLVDERQVPEESPRSNAALLRKTLLVNDAAATRFVPLFRNEAEAAALSLDVVVLGMGTDGHTASFFPGGDTLAETIDPHTDQSLIAITAPGSGEARLTFTLPKLLAASTLCLHIEGEEKLRVLEEALSGDNAHAMPIRAVLASAQPLSLYWCP